MIGIKHNTPCCCGSVAESVISYLASRGFDPFLLKSLVEMSMGKSSLRSPVTITTEADAVKPLESRENKFSTKEPSLPSKMDLNAEFDRVTEGMKWGEMVSSLEDTIFNFLDDTANPSPPTYTPPPTAPAGLEVNTHSQPAESEDGKFVENTVLEDAIDLFDLLSPLDSPHAMLKTLCEEDIMEPVNMNKGSDQFSLEQYLHYDLPVHDAPTSSAPAFSPPAAPPQQQYLPYDLPVNYAPTSSAPAAFSPPAAPPQQQYDGEPLRPSASLQQYLQPAGVLNGDVYQVPAANFPTTSSAAPLPSTSYSRKRTLVETQQDDGQYIKKPPNAFMLFMREQRPNVPADIKGKGSASTNAFLGQRWKSLTGEQKAVYYDFAEAERNLHNQLYPHWTGGNNYGKKRKRERKRAPTRTEGVMEPSREQTGVMAPNPLQTGGMMPYPSQLVLQEPHRETAVKQPGPLPHTGQPSFQQLPVLDSHDHQTLMVDVFDPSTGAMSVIYMQPMETIYLPQPETFTSMMEPHNPQSVLMQLPETQTPFSAPVCQSCYLPRVFKVISGLQQYDTTSTYSNDPCM